jgi:outer membrane protein assembly factor BamB
MVLRVGRWGMCAVAGLASIAGCGSDGGSGRSTVADTSGSNAAAMSPASSTAMSIAPPSGASCGRATVEAPSVVALDASSGGFCWSAVTDWNVDVAVLAGDDLILTGEPCADGQGGQFALFALEPATGREVWRVTLPPETELPSSESGSPRAVSADEQVVVAPFGGGTAGFDLASGEERWRVDGVAPLASGADFVVGRAGGPESRTLVALDRRSGTQRWSTVVPGEYLGGVAADSTVVLVTVGETTVAYDAATGARRWEAPFAQASDTYAVRIIDGVATGVTGTGSNPNAIQAFDVATGRPLWTSPASPVQRPEPTDGNVYVDVGDGGVGALDPTTGRLRWKVEHQQETGGIVAGPGLVLDVQNGEWQALDPSTGQLRWTSPVDQAELPVVGSARPNGFTVSGAGVLPTSAGVFLLYGNCLGN